KAERSFQALLDSSKLNARASNAPSGVVGGVVGGVIGGTPVEALPVPPPAAAPASLAAATVAQHSSVPPLGYEVERRGPAGEYVVGGNFSDLEDHDVVRVRFRPSRSGFLA